MTDISIIIRTKNEGKSILKTLEKISYQKINKTFEIIIVDSGSTDNTLEIAKKFTGRILKITSEKFTYPYALNFGTEHTNGELIVYLSAHCPPVNDYWLYHLTKHFFDPNVAGVFGKEIPIKGLNQVYEYSQLYEMFPSNGSTYVLFSCPNACIRKKVWDRYKFDERVPKKYPNVAVVEDQLWAQMVKQKGYKIIYEPKSIVYHSHKFSLKNLIRNYSGGYFSKEMSDNYSPILSENSFQKKIKMYIKKKINCFKYLVKNHYFKAILWDFPCSILFEVVLFYLGKRDREKEDESNNSFKNNPHNSKRLPN
ncbi:MAG: hypothetical protein BWK75_00935 [Candidatus Altiarchaeales archaeon A3]|nr:MAG: hypothetical protein BWK75_00935 [Candidatus Altiarchaeales archaeon A3]